MGRLGSSSSPLAVKRQTRGRPTCRAASDTPRDAPMASPTFGEMSQPERHAFHRAPKTCPQSPSARRDPAPPSADQRRHSAHAGTPNARPFVRSTNPVGLACPTSPTRSYSASPRQAARNVLAGDFRKINPAAAKVIRVEAVPKLLQAFSEELSRYAGVAYLRWALRSSPGQQLRLVTRRACHFPTQCESIRMRGVGSRREFLAQRRTG
jgi:hypothetical protein